MWQAVITQPGVVETVETPDPAPAPDEVVVKVEACGVCGTDRSIFAGEVPMDYPCVLGHEFAGTVVEVGAAVRGQTVGQRVAVDPNIVCYACPPCRRGNINLCVNLSPLGISRPGGFAEYSAVPERNAYAIPESVSFEEGGLIEPLACSIRGLQIAGVELGDVVAVLGAGSIGCMLVQLARLRGAAFVAVSEPDPGRRAQALRFGADRAVGSETEFADTVLEKSEGLGADVVLEATGQIAAASFALSLVRRGGTVVWFGTCPERERLKISPFWVNDAEVSLRGSLNNPNVHSRALALVAMGKVDLASLVTDRVSLDQVQPALGRVAYAGATKVVVTPTVVRP